MDITQRVVENLKTRSVGSVKPIAKTCAGSWLQILTLPSYETNKCEKVTLLNLKQHVLPQLDKPTRL